VLEEEIPEHMKFQEDKVTSLPQVVSRGSSVDIVTGYGLGDRGFIPDRGRGFFF
jgi:hypothetical protein